MIRNQVILVNKNDQEIGVEEKLKAHQEGLLHRAFSIFIFNTKGKMLIQQRALDKYHCGGLWTNACCSHPQPGEKLESAVHERLQKEMGFDCPLEQAFHFTYKIKFEKDHLFEHELDHVFVGTYDGEVTPNANEVASYRWITLEELKQEISAHPENFAYWFKLSVDHVINYFQNS